MLNLVNLKLGITPKTEKIKKVEVFTLDNIK